MNYNETVREMVNEAYDLMVEYGHSATLEGTEAAVSYGYDNKANLREILSNSTLGTWIPEKDQLLLDFTYVREVDDVLFNRCLYEISQIFDKRIFDGKCSPEGICASREKEYQFRRIMSGIRTNVVDTERIKELQKYLPELRVNEGMKTSRVVNKFYTKLFDCQKYSEFRNELKRNENGTPLKDEDGYFIYEKVKHFPYNKIYAKLADCCNPITIKRKVIFSISYIDFLTMSFGNTWSSCHTIDKENMRNSRGSHYEGMYCGGCLSYANDATTIIVYTVDENYDPDKGYKVSWNGNYYSGYETQDKINRQLIHVNGNVMIQARLYPQSNDGATDLYKVFRDIEERVIASGKGKPNLWKYEGHSNMRDVATTPYEAHNYQDYFSYVDCGICVLKGDDGEYNHNAFKMVIGHYGIDVNDGTEIPGGGEFDGWLTQVDADTVVCADCGGIISEENAYLIDGEWYCEDCVYYCESCNEYHSRNQNEPIYVSGYGDLCENGLSREIENGNIIRCERCGEYFVTSGWNAVDGYYTEDGYWYCSTSCYRDDGYVRDLDDNLIPESDAVQLCGDWYRMEDNVTCDFCGQLIEAGDATEIDGRICCDECKGTHTNQHANTEC